MPDDVPPTLDPLDFAVASPDEIAEVLSYALRYDERGKPRRSGWEFAASIAAERLTEHLRLSGYVVVRARAVVVAQRGPGQ